jgi:hypothetical protein
MQVPRAHKRHDVGVWSQESGLHNLDALCTNIPMPVLPTSHGCRVAFSRGWRNSTEEIAKIYCPTCVGPVFYWVFSLTVMCRVLYLTLKLLPMLNAAPPSKMSENFDVASYPKRMAPLDILDKTYLGKEQLSTPHPVQG